MADRKKVIAVHTIHRTLEPGKPGDREKGIRPTPPKVQVIQKGTVFSASTVVEEGKEKSEFDELLEAKAIREPEKGEKVEVAAENLTELDTEAAKTPKAARTAPSAKTETKATAAAAKSDKPGSGSGGADDANNLV